MNDFGERLQKLRGRLAREKLGEAIGVSKTAVKNWEEGTNQPKYEYIQKLANYFNVDFQWLATGYGAQISNGVDASAQIIESITVDGDITEKVILPILDAKVSCGNGYINGDHMAAIGNYEVTKGFLGRLHLPPSGKDLMLVRSDGDSMLPTIPDNTLILVNAAERDYDDLLSGNIYVFNVSGEVICKRAYRNLDGTLTLRSDNGDRGRYPDIEVTREKFESFNIIGRARFAFVAL